MTIRSGSGRETWRRLLEWDRESAAAERLAAQILRLEGFRDIDPSHPLGGRDGLKDVVCTYRGERWIGAAYFPRGQQSLKDISEKLVSDAEGVARNSAQGIAFVTNQELRLAERDSLAQEISPIKLELFHLERIASLLDSPQAYGLRLEFLDIEMTKEEQVAFLASRDVIINDMSQTIATMWAHVSSSLPPKKKKSSGDLPIAFATNVGSAYATSSVYGSSVRECKFCGELFQVSDMSTTYATVGFGDLSIVRCPECGKTQKYSRF